MTIIEATQTKYLRVRTQYRPRKQDPYAVATTAGTALEYVYFDQTTNDKWREQVKQMVGAGTFRRIKWQRWKITGAVASQYRWSNPGAGYPDADGTTVDTLCLGPTVYTPPSILTPLGHLPYATQKFWANVYDALGKFEGWSALGELRRTIGTFRSPFRSIRELLTKHHSRCKRYGSTAESWKTYRRAVAGSWLEIQFGLKPAIRDVEALATVAKNISMKDMSVRVFGVAEDLDTMETKTWLHSSQYVQSVMRTKVTRVRLTRKKTRISGAIVVPAITPTERYGFDTGSLVLGLWEIAPWSFLIDYVFSIEEFIKSMLARKSYVRWTSITTKWDSTDYIRGAPIPGPNYSAYKAGHSVLGTLSAEVQAKHLLRENSLPAVVLPSIHISNSLFSLANAIALLASRGKHSSKWAERRFTLLSR
jgi:hypothetical protein